VPRDPVVECIENRALLFQGLSVSREQLEPLQLVQYSLNQSYNYHTDWFPPPNPSARSPSPVNLRFGGNRVSSFFAYISATPDLIGGGTNFPLLDAPRGEEWCEYIDCDEEWENGVTFRPVEGNAVFWVNLKDDGEGDERVLHKGVKVERGGKVGMNIWTREGPLSNEVRGE
jgi:prolyl 4-hydroxylase